MERESDKIQAFINLRQKLLSSLENNWVIWLCISKLMMCNTGTVIPSSICPDSE